jgi:enterochelin esterase-like enzyme
MPSGTTGSGGMTAVSSTGGGTSTPGGGGRGTGGTVAAGGSASVGSDPGTTGDGDFTIMPPYAGTVQVTNVPHSAKFQFMMTSTIYPGGSRPITVYIPKQYVDGTAAPFIIITDGNAPATGSPEIVTAAENHYQDTDPLTRIPPIVWVFVPPGTNRSGEYDTVSDAYTRFINTEVLPLVNSNADIKAMYPGFKLTTDPEGRAAYGCSSGSPAAMGLGWFGDFHRIVSYSGTFVALQMTTDHPLGAWEYPTMILATMPPKPLRIFLEVGEMDNGYMTAETGHRNWVIGNRNMAAALKMMGYHYRFLFAMGAGHCEGGVKSKTYAETLAWVWRGYVGP